MFRARLAIAKKTKDSYSHKPTLLRRNNVKVQNLTLVDKISSTTRSITTSVFRFFFLYMTMFASGLLNDLIFNMLFLWHDYIHCPNFTLNSFQKLGLSKPVGGIPCDVATMCGLNPPPHPSPPTVCAREAARACLSACTSCRMLASPVPFRLVFGETCKRMTLVAVVDLYSLWQHCACQPG